jgi:hypothetical protein
MIQKDSEENAEKILKYQYDGSLFESDLLSN